MILRGQSPHNVVGHLFARFKISDFEQSPPSPLRHVHRFHISLVTHLPKAKEADSPRGRGGGDEVYDPNRIGDHIRSHGRQLKQSLGTSASSNYSTSASPYLEYSQITSRNAYGSSARTSVKYTLPVAGGGRRPRGWRTWANK